MITKLAFVAHPTRDMAAAKRFWGALLGLKNSANYQDVWAEFDTPEGKSIALDSFSPEGTHPYLALETDNIEAEIARLRAQGVTVLKDTWDNQVCKMAIVADPAGNGVMLHQIAPDRLAAMKEASAAKPAAPKKKSPAKTKAKPKAKTKAKTTAKPAPRKQRPRQGKAKRSRKASRS